MRWCLQTFRDSRLTAVLGMSASWDSTLRLWDIHAGKPLGVMEEKNKARGFALYKDNNRAVSTGSAFKSKRLGYRRRQFTDATKPVGNRPHLNRVGS
jgi:hypothetical protein